MQRRAAEDRCQNAILVERASTTQIAAIFDPIVAGSDWQ
jgi:hypothetical protein